MSKPNVTFIRLHTFDDNLKHSLAFAEEKNKESTFLNKFLYRIKKYVQTLKSNNPNITESEVEEIFSKDIEELSSASYKGAKISKNYLKYICYDVFANSPNKLHSLLDFLHTNNLKFSDIQNLNRSTYQLALLYYASQLKNDFDNSPLDNDIDFFVQKNRDAVADILKDDIIDSITAITSQLNKFGLLSTYLEINRKKLSFLYFREYADCISDDTNNPGKLLQLLSKENLQRYSPFDLLSLYSSWVNRYYKELETYSEAMFVVHDFNLIPSMIDGSFKALPKDLLKKSLAKMNLFYDPTRFYLEMQKAEKLSENEETEFDISDNVYSFSDEPFIRFINTEYDSKYKNFFDSYLPESKNDLIADAKTYFNLYNPIFATYSLKDSTMLYLLLSILETNNRCNAGLIPSSIIDNKAVFPRFVGIGIDNGMNDTFLLHIKSDTLNDFLSRYLANENRLVPLYSGEVDFTNGLYSTPVFFPMSDEQKKLISRRCPSWQTKKIAYLQHLRKVRDGNNKRSSLQKSYVNFSTREVFSNLKEYPDFDDEPSR